ncbi:MAG: hypothetical protein IIA45_11755 [Bacteroidetes bacterium]|nr:hypothetical protein [Bacteroidota bacterium]
MQRLQFIDRFFKKALERFQARPPAEMWDRISGSLDNPATPAAKPGSSRWLRITTATLAVSAVVLVLLNYSGINDFVRGRLQPQNSELISKTTQTGDTFSANSTKITAPTIITPHPSVEDITPPAPTAEDANKQIPVIEPRLIERFDEQETVDNHLQEIVLETIEPVEEEEVISDDTPSKAELIESIMARLMESTGNENKNDMPSEEMENYLVQEDAFNIADWFSAQSILPRGFYVGASASANSTWIINQNTYDNFDGYELAYMPDFGMSHEVTAGYNFTDMFAIETAWIIKSYQGQKYEDLIKYKNVTREVDLEYTKVPILLKFKAAKLGGKNLRPSSFNLSLGMYIGRLQYVEITTNNSISNEVNERFNLYDYGFAFGLERERLFRYNWSYSYGFNAHLGLVDINAPTYAVHDELGQSFNALGGLKVGLKYMIRN